MSGDATDLLIRSLLNPAAYLHPVAPIDLVETHISWVLLTGQFAYKIKKPVDLGFVNFSTLPRRHLFCEQEVRLNRRLAPDIYLDVQPITGPPESPVVGGVGTPIEFAVRMRQFPQDQLLSRLIAVGGLMPRHVDALASHVAEFHSRVPVAEPSSRFGTPEAVAAPIRATFADLKLPDVNHYRVIVERLQVWCERELDARRDAIETRKQNGFVRECHGDMHLGNMILADGAITIFDCIEFNEDLRWIDVLSDVAFCTMDMTDRGRTDLARRFLNAYLEWSGDYAGLIVLPIYLTYRALVRAKVAALRRAQADVTPEEGKRLTHELQNYLDMADRLTRPARRFLAITHGVSGSGKTWGSQAIVERLGAIRLRSDLERKRLAGLEPLAKSGSRVARDLYAADVTQRTYETLERHAVAVLNAGFPAVVDATFLERSQRDRLRSVSDKIQVPFVIADFPTDAATCRQRIRDRSRVGTDVSEGTEDVLDHQLRSRKPLGDDEQPFVIPINTTRPDLVANALAEVDRLRC